jgi:hypothetical protein
MDDSYRDFERDFLFAGAGDFALALESKPCDLAQSCAAALCSSTFFSFFSDLDLSPAGLFARPLEPELESERFLVGEEEEEGEGEIMEEEAEKVEDEEELEKDATMWE